jgi:hypothetical protein
MDALPEKMPRPEREAKPVGFIMLRADERAQFDALSSMQKGYFLHWLRSNPKDPQWSKAMLKAIGQRP